MTRQDVFEYVKKQYGIEPEYSGESWNAALRVKVLLSDLNFAP